MVLQSDMMYPAVGYKHQHNYSHEEEDYYAQNAYNYSSMQMMRPKPTPTANYMISSSQPSECHVAMPPADSGYFGRSHDQHNKDKYYGNTEKSYEELRFKETYHDGHGGYHDNRNKDKYYGHTEKFNTEGFMEKYQDNNGYGRHENRNKDKYYETNKEGFNRKESFNHGGFKDGYGYKDSFDHGHYGNGHNGGKYEEGHNNKFSVDKMVSGGGGGYGAETHFVTPHMRPRPFDHEMKMDHWEFKSIDD